ncbi:PREDICTED: uncharacterized protein LOC100631577 [Amphimedon queenslandica]|uniref:Protein kinase domain-containing protein n=1 Tax=Amphimedon queenslandica TaxID=400682 RepID=A0A1X7UCT3_AMPQE|nr:PREDICTED: uncharacterized protein LOC100631577 [Amphimedon queenslandica]|eukprot:XP_003388321.1 PREDICTED: uncharacterized protein LOC100631577 [Amphimedon queenslandica]
MNLMDLLLADALAAGMARQAAEANRPPPDNFFIIPPDAQAWRKLYSTCKEENMVICVEVTDDSHPPSRRMQPHIVNLAREVPQIPFFRAKIGLGRTYDELRQDLGGIRFTPSVVILFFDDDGVRIKKAEGEEEIKMALRIGAFEKIIQDFIDQRMKLKLAEKFAEQLAGAMASDIARKRREAALEYEEKLRKEKAEKERKEKEAREKELEEERRKRIEAEKKAEEAKASEQKARLKSYAVDELMRMDLNNAKIRDIKDKMDDLGLSYAGCTSREDLIKKLTANVPSLKTKMDQTDGGGGRPSTSYVPSSYSSSQRHSSGILYSNKPTDTGPSDNGEVIKLRRKVEQLQGNIEEINVMRESLEDELARKNREIAALKSRGGGIGRVPLFGGGGGGGDSFTKVKELENELLETRMLYTCTLDDFEVLGVISRGKLAEGRSMMVVRAQCIKPGLPYPDRVYALKMLSGVHDTTTMTNARDQHKNEYEVLSSIPPHKNIVRLFAFFYDRPKAHPKLSRENCSEGIALCIMMEQLSQNMEYQLKPLRQTAGPNYSKVLGWLKDLLTGLQYLFTHYVLHRDLKLENLMLSGDILKIVDFGEAIKLEPDYKIPFDRPCSKGGNEAHLAPEILNQRTGRGRVLDYTKQPVWAAGVLAYELAGYQNPFSGSKDQRAYDERTLPRLTDTYSKTGRGQKFPPEFPNIVTSMLSFEPARRPTLSEALNKITKLV